MKKLIRVVMLTVVGIGLQKTGLAQNFQKEINEQVWKIQLEAMNTNQSELFLSVMSKDVVQISYDRHVIRNYAEFAEQVKRVYDRIKEKKLSRQMEFRFLERIASASQAFESGYFKYEVTNEKGEKSNFYGVFQVVLRKENGTWKVLVDYEADTYYDKPVTAELFNNASLLDSYEGN